jgi:putative MATE family efflux protein
MILELSLESVFAVVDMYFVSKLPDSRAAVATVGLTESMVTLIYTVGIGLSTAATALVARRIGEKDIAKASHAGAQSILLAILVSVLMAILGYCYAPDLLQIMGAQQEVILAGTDFSRIMLGGTTSIILLFLINGIFRGAGDPMIAMKSLWLASLINIILCPLLIFGYGIFPELGLTGAAVATTIGRTAGVFYQTYHLFKGSGMLKIKREHFKIDWAIQKSILTLAWPATLQFFIQSGSWIFLAYLVSTTGSTDASAGYQIAIRNVVFFILPAWGLSNAAATLVGQNLGAGNPDRAQKSVLLTTRYNIYFMAAVMLLFVFFSSPIISIFTSQEEVHRYGVLALQIMGTGYIFYGIGMVMMQALNGAGDTRTPTWINFVGFWLFQIPVAILMARYFGWGPTGAFIAIPLAETFVALAAWYFFKRGSWKEIKI